jgi:hypothetical protein
MNLKLLRLQENDDATLGVLYNGMNFVCYTLEDEERQVKVKGETRIPAGKYEIKLREVLSPMTQKYRDKFPWFSYHLEIQDVPDFDYVYLHIGNSDDDSDGCILLGDNADSKNFKIWNSTNAFERFYKTVSMELQWGNKVNLEIFNLK